MTPTRAREADLGKREMDALREIAWRQRHGLGRGTGYRWRQASMRKLAVLGLVEVMPAYQGETLQVMPYRITAAGLVEAGRRAGASDDV
jgi:hypothetical protein